MLAFSNILHDWPGETNLQLLQKAFDCLNPGGDRVVISELLLADNGKSSTSSSKIKIPYFTKGRQYRPKELHRRLERIGFCRAMYRTSWWMITHQSKE